MKETKILDFSNYNDLKEILDSRKYYFKNQPLDKDYFLKSFLDSEYYTKNKLIFGYFVDDILDRFMIIHFYEGECIVGLQVSKEGIIRKKNYQGWTKEYSDFFTDCLKYIISKGYNSFWTLTPEIFRDNEKNEMMPIYDLFEVVYHEKILQNTKSDSKFIFKYVSEGGLYKITTIVKKYKLK